MPRHVITMLVVMGLYFTMLWVGVVLLKQSPGVTVVVSFVTLILLSIGVAFTSATVRGDREQRDQ